MTDTTTRLALPLLAAAQAQKHVTHNEALVALDRLVHLTALDRRNAPPATPAEGDAHLVGDAPTGAFAGHAGEVATFDGSAWRFDVPARGWILWLADEAAALVFDGTGWADLKPRSADRLGIAATADNVNRLAVASPAVLFTHAGAGTQVKLNKAAAADTASLLFQTGWSGRAEMGTAGDDKFRFKVSADGSTWATAMTVEPATAYTGFGNESPVSRLDILGTSLQQAQIKTRTEAGSANLGGGLLLHHNNAAGALPVSGDRLGYLLFGTTNGSANIQGGGITARAEGDYSPTSLPTYFAFETAPAGATARAERLRITADGRVGIGTTAPAVKLDVDGPVRCKSYSVAGLPAASAGAGQIAMVSDESGGAVLAFSDGAAWRRVTDRAVVS
jgi:hypothetical protein